MMPPPPGRCPHLPHDLDRHLDDLECAVCAAVVPGDISSWAEGVLERLDASGGAWQAARDTWLAMTDEIRTADPALAPRMRALRDRVSEMDREMGALRSALAGIRKVDGETPDELQEANDLRRELLSWSVACRSIGGELDTWFTEAYYRDRGVGD